MRADGVPVAARGVSGIGRETAEIIRAGRYSASFRGFSQRILPFSGKICIFVSIVGKCGPVFASLLNPRADEDFAGFGLIIKKKLILKNRNAIAEVFSPTQPNALPTL